MRNFRPKPSLIAIIISLLFLTSCLGNEKPPPKTPTPRPDPASADQPASQFLPLVSAPRSPSAPMTEPQPVGLPPPIELDATLKIDALVPLSLQARITPSEVTVDAEDGSVRLTIGEGIQVGSWVYAVVAPFPTVQDDITMAEINDRWTSLGGLVMAEQTYAIFAKFWGDSPVVEVVPEENVSDRIWVRDGNLALVPFDKLLVDLKVLALDGVSPLQQNFNLDSYPLDVPISLSGDESARAEILAQLPLPLTNRFADRMTRIAMTGVTALVRATAFEMEVNGILYPTEEVADLIRAADIAHLSNEVAFAPDCPYPNRVGGTLFCSAEKYFEVLTHLGIDVVELTGNHVNDYGADALASSIDTYEAANMKWFGGGRNSADARTPALVEHNGNLIAFVGCNPVGPSYAWAGEATAGSRPCGQDVYDQISTLSQAGTLVIMTLQYQEHYFYESTAPQQADFRSYIDSGATIVSGSQGHHAQGFALYNGGFIHYGLGNLFFDQMQMLGTRQTFIDHYTIHNGQLISVEFDTGLIENWARPRIMTPDERANLLRTVFAVSEFER